MSNVNTLLLLPLALAAGCADSGRTATIPVEGTLLVDGRPVANAHIAFHSVGGVQVNCPVGVTGPDGAFRLTTYAAGDGAPEGEYVVTVLWLADSMPADPCECPDLTIHDRLHGRYADAGTSTLRASIGPGRRVVSLETVTGGSWNTSAAAGRTRDRKPDLTLLDQAALERSRNGDQRPGAPPSPGK